jgi:hypothetical protein
MSLFSLWLTTSYLPSTERPMVDLTTSLTKVDQNAQSTAVKATITLHNRGLASAVIVGSAYRVVSSSEPSLPFTGPASDASFVSNSDPPIRNELDQGLATEFGFVAPPDESIYGAGVLGSGEIAPMREFLLPGQTWSTEVVFNVPYAPYTTYPTRVRLTAQIALLTDRYLGDTRACQNATTNQLGSNFLREARTVHRATLRAFGTPVPVSPPTSLAPPTTDSSLPFTGPSAKATAPARRETLDYLCVRTALQPQSEVQNLTGNHPSIKTVYVLSGAPHMDASRFPYLVVGYENGAKTSSDEVALRQAQAIDAKNPTAVIESRSEYLVLDPTAKRGQ